MVLYSNCNPDSKPDTDETKKESKTKIDWAKLIQKFNVIRSGTRQVKNECTGSESEAKVKITFDNSNYTPGFAYRGL